MIHNLFAPTFDDPVIFWFPDLRYFVTMWNILWRFMNFRKNLWHFVTIYDNLRRFVTHWEKLKALKSIPWLQSPHWTPRQLTLSNSPPHSINISPNPSRYKTVAVLAVHKLVHGEKKFSCDQCNYRATTKNKVRLHKAVHAEKQHSCDICGKKFSLLSILKVTTSIKCCKKLYCKSCTVVVVVKTVLMIIFLCFLLNVPCLK